MVLGIDATNIRAGGGMTHLAELLRNANPPQHGFSRVIVWGSQATIAQLDAASWLDARTVAELDRGLLRRSLWQRFSLHRLAEKECSLLFIPGGTFSGPFRPVVTMAQNLLPFEWKELRRYGLTPMAAKLAILRHMQSRSFRRSQGVIHLTEFARSVVNRVAGAPHGQSVVIPHGIGPRFFMAPRPARSLAECSTANPLRALYVSIIDEYKHQDHVAEAVVSLRAQGVPISLDLVGPSYGPALARLRALLTRIDPRSEFVRYRGPILHAELQNVYRAADLCIFASTCETISIILLEGMAAGLPIACSGHGALREILGDAGIFFDAEAPASIAGAVETLARSSSLRAQLAARAFERAGTFTWDRCARDTFAFLESVAGAQAARRA